MKSGWSGRTLELMISSNGAEAFVETCSTVRGTLCEEIGEEADHVYCIAVAGSG